MPKKSNVKTSVAEVPGMTLIERLRFPLIAVSAGQTFLEAELALRRAAADELERLAPVKE